ncbi:MAG: four-helix bundle copper-binding protein [Dysgonomonas sp.]|nr:four-helix bundle copper-binding protein [Dysgonomonas sp.]
MNACLEEEHVSMMKECIRLDNECSIICSATLQLVHKNSHFMKDILDLCAKACDACAQECAKHPQDHCQECAKVCKECAQACREFMSK